MDGTVLVADDDRTIRTVLTQALTRAGCKVHATSSLMTLMRWVEEGKGDLVISDVIMPDENGLDLVPRIRRIRPDLRVVVMSAQSTFSTALKATQRGAFDYLPKPFDLKELIAIVRHLAAEPKEGAVLATLVAAEGSSYRRPGARLLLTADGERINVDCGSTHLDQLRQAVDAASK